MTLKDNFKQYVYGFNEERSENLANKCNEIADDYAIEFAEWLRTDWTCDERWSKITDSKELLEIFKKEKGL